MKKRKPPIVLISIIILMLIGVAIMNTPQSDKKKEDVVQNGQTTDSAASVASQQKNIVAKAELPKKNPNPVHSGERAGMDAPAIKVMKRGDMAKQKPNDSSQMGQWYTDESATSAPGGITVTSPPR